MFDNISAHFIIEPAFRRNTRIVKILNFIYRAEQNSNKLVR